MGAEVNLTGVQDISDAINGAEIVNAQAYEDGFHINLTDGRVIVCVSPQLIVYVGRIEPGRVH